MALAYQLEPFDLRNDIFQDLVVLDLETLMHQPQDIIQIAALRILRGKILTKPFHSYVKPRRKVDPDTTDYTGITNRDVSRAPSVSEVFASFSMFCGDSTLIAHNGVQFDFRLIQEVCASGNSPVREARCIDSMHLSWNLWGRQGVRHRLYYDVASRLKVRKTGLRLHDARHDARLLAMCVSRILQRLQRSHRKCELKVYRMSLPEIDREALRQIQLPSEPKQ